MGLESKIRKFLYYQSHRFTEDDLLNYFTEQEQKTSEFFYFLIHARFKKMAAEILVKDFNIESETFWAHLFELLNVSLDHINPHMVKYINYLLPNDEITHKLSFFKGLDIYTDSLAHIREEAFDEFEELQIYKQKKLYDQLHFYKREGLLKKEKETLDQLLFLQPNDKTLKQHELDWEQRWASQVFNNKKIYEKEPLLSKKQRDFEKNNQEKESEIKNVIYQKAKEYCSNDSKYVYDFAMLFYFVEDYKLSLKMVENYKPLKHSLFRAHLYYMNKEYIFCLELLDKIEMLHQTADVLFEVNYIKAQCYWFLDQKEKAIHHMKTIVNIKPHYKSAETILRFWESEISL